MLGKKHSKNILLKSTEATVNEKKKTFYISFFGEIISQCLDVIVLGEMEVLIVSPSGFRYLNSPRDACRVQYVDYMDEIASGIAVKPNLFSLFLWDPKLALELFLGPCTSYQYRLQGPGKWAGPREAILTQRERIIKPLRTRTLICAQAPCCVPLWLKSISVALLLFVLTFIIIKG